MEERYIKYVDQFNDGDFDSLLPFFDNMENILKFFHKKDLLQYVDPFDSNLEDYQNELLNYLINVLGDKETLEQCVAQLSDVIPKDGVYYLRVGDREDLAQLFYDGGRDTTARDVADAVLKDDNDMFERWGSTTDDIYRDVVEELNPENIELLKTYILDRLTNWKIEVDDETPDLFQNYVEDDGFFYLTPENVGDVIGDEESFMYLIDNDYLDDLSSELYSIHSNAYNSAYETEVYNDVMSELETFFDVKTAKWESVALYGNPEKLIEVYYIKFNPNEVISSIKKYVGDSNNWGYYDYNINSVGSWLNMMNTFMDNGDETWLDFRIPDYPDSSLVDRYINEMFGDYI
jgi:RNA binding exosome subunit